MDESNTPDSAIPWQFNLESEQPEERMDTLFQGIPDPIGVYQKTDRGLIFVGFNRATDEMSRGKIGQSLGKTIDELYAGQPGMAEHAYRCLERKQNLTFETLYRLVGTGEDRNMVFTFVYVPDDRILIHAHDITERVRAERALLEMNQALEQRVAERTAELERTNEELTREIQRRQKTEAALRDAEQQANDLLRYAPTAIYEIDFRGPRLTRVNDAMCRMSGYSREELLAMSPLDLLDAEGQNQLRRRAQAVLAGKPVEESVEYKVKTKDGREIYAVLQTQPVYEDGKPIGIFAAAHDVTERKRAEQELRQALQAASESETHFESLYQSLPYLAVVYQKIGDDFVLTEYNRAAVSFTQGGIPTLVGKTVREIYATQPQIREHIERAYAERSTLQLEAPYRLVTTGEQKFLISNYVYVSPDRVLVFVEDITERKRAEQALRESEERFRTVLENSVDAAYRRNLQTDRYDYLSPVIERITGFTAEEFSRLSLDETVERIHPDDRARVQAEVGQTLNGIRKTATAEYRLLGKDGQYHWLSDNLTMLPDASGRPLYWVGIVRDVTERRQVEERIAALNRELERHSAELSAANKELESFAYSVSHDLRTPLATIDNLASMLEQDYGAQMPEIQHYLNLIRAGTREMEVLIQSLLTLSRVSRQAIQKQTVDMAALAMQAIEAAHPEPDPTDVTLDIRDLPDAEGDPVLLKQVWVNLISNAFKFTRKCESARIEIGALKLEDGNSRREDVDPNSPSTVQPPTSKVAYYVRDNGVGFDMEQADRLFGVFQRLHAEDEYEGTGIGLAIVARVVRRHGGRVWAEGEEGKGATFYFTL